MARIGVFPGSFNPPTVAHLAIAEQARRQHRLDRVDLVVSMRALAKETIDHPRFDHRIAVLEATVAQVPGVAVVVTGAQLLGDIAEGYDVVIMGADKWWQIHELRWYESAEHRRLALDALPSVAIVPREGFESPPGLTLALDDVTLGTVSSTRARNGELDLMSEPARNFALRTGAWIDVARYERRFAGSEHEQNGHEQRE